MSVYSFTARSKTIGLHPVYSKLQGVCIGAELLSPSPSRRAEMLPPLGFNYNHGANYVPCIITDNRGRGVLARYTRVIMGPDLHVIGIIPGDQSQYGGPLHAIPVHDQGECPQYAQDNFWCFKFGTDEKDQFDSTLDFLHNLLLTAEVTCYHKTSCLFFQYQEEMRKLKERMWEASQLKDPSGRRLEGANALHRIKEVQVELNRRSAAQQVLMECGCST